MTNNIKIIIGVLAVILIGTFIYFKSAKPAVNEEPPVATEDSIVGCYVATLSKDVYSLKVLSQEGEKFKGTLVFNNFEKDSSSGTYEGTYKNGILLGDYSFHSEGMESVMQVIFKKSGNDFIRGYGELNSDGTRFADLNNITYDLSQIFKASSECASPS